MEGFSQTLVSFLDMDDQGDGLPIGIMRCSDAVGEALAVANQVEAYLKSGRVPAFEMAVMYRTNAQSRSFEEAFLRKVLPFVVIGAQRFYERREVSTRSGISLPLVHAAVTNPRYHYYGIGEQSALCESDGRFSKVTVPLKLTP